MHVPCDKAGLAGKIYNDLVARILPVMSEDDIDDDEFDEDLDEDIEDEGDG